MSGGRHRRDLPRDGRPGPAVDRAGRGRRLAGHRTARPGGLPYQGPSPLLVFVAAIPVSLVAVIVLSLPLVALGVDVDSPFGRFLSVAVQTLVYIGLIRLLVVDAGALSWSEMGIRRLGRPAVVRDPRRARAGHSRSSSSRSRSRSCCCSCSRSRPVSPLPPTGELTGFLLQFAAGAIIAPIGEELLFRGLATTAWVRGLGVRRGRPPRGARVRAGPRHRRSAGSTTEEAFGLAVVGFATRVPVALALAGCSSGAARSGRRSACTWPSTGSCSSSAEVALRAPFRSESRRRAG